MSAVAKYDIPYTELEASMVAWLEEALELRHGTGGDPQGKITDLDPRQGTEALMSLLTRVRLRADRVDELMAKATRARARFRRARDEAQFAFDVSFDENTSKQSARRSFEDYSSRDDRRAEALLASMTERQATHEARRLVSVAEEVYDVISQVHWQLDAIRKDLRASLHALQFESKLEN